MASSSDPPFDVTAFNRARLRAGLNLTELAKACKVSTNHISAIAGGGKRPSPALVKVIAEVLGLDSPLDLYRDVA